MRNLSPNTGPTSVASSSTTAQARAAEPSEPALPVSGGSETPGASTTEENRP